MPLMQIGDERFLLAMAARVPVEINTSDPLGYVLGSCGPIDYVTDEQVALGAGWVNYFPGPIGLGLYAPVSYSLCHRDTITQIWIDDQTEEWMRWLNTTDFRNAGPNIQERLFWAVNGRFRLM